MVDAEKPLPVRRKKKPYDVRRKDLGLEEYQQRLEDGSIAILFHRSLWRVLHSPQVYREHAHHGGVTHIKFT